MADLKKKVLDPSRIDRPLAELAALDPFVSERSRWSSEQWVLDGLTPGYPNFKVYWYPGETPAALLNELKLLAACLFLPRGTEAPHLKYSNGAHYALAARFLAEFMTRRGYASLSELADTAFTSFQRAVEAGIASPPAFDARTPGGEINEDDIDEEAEREIEVASTARDVEIDRPSYAFACHRLHIWNWMHWVRADLAQAGVLVDPADRFAAKTLPKLAAELSAKGVSEVEDLPDEVVLPVLAEAHRLIGEPAEQAIALQSAYLALGPAPSGNRAQAEHTEMRREALASHPLILDGQIETWLERPADPSVHPGYVVQDAVRTIRDACLLVLAAGIGWRISEAASVEVEPQDDDRLPSCILVTKSHSRTSDHFWIRGKLSKHRPEPTPEDWLIGARLSGTGAEPMTVRAVRVLERLFRPWREMAPSPLLAKQLVLNWNGPNPPSDPLAIRRIKSEAIRIGMQQFIRRRAGLGERLAPLVAGNPRLRAYQEERGANVRPHQWRRTFFRLMYRMDDNLLPAISRHFKHVSLAVTENGYGPRSPAAAQELDAITTSELVARLFQRGEGGPPPVTGGDVALARHRAVLSSIIGGATLEEATPRLAAFAVNRDLRLWPAAHGDCLIGLNPDKAACHVRGGRIDWRADRPNLSRRNPGLCCSCPNLVVTVANLPFWQRRYRQNRDSWLGSGRDPAFRAARDRAAQARTMIEHLGGDPEAPEEKEQTT